ncbi:MAG: hypothetical protein P4L87_12285 [Formivibrio sp.]|nr:hypothetical protein [Formivibrio sp.]
MASLLLGVTKLFSLCGKYVASAWLEWPKQEVALYAFSFDALMAIGYGEVIPYSKTSRPYSTAHAKRLFLGMFHTEFV